jgi:tetratricopeptide (TPR) repeat protein
VRRFGESSEIVLREAVAKALYNKGYRLGELKRSEEAIAVYDEVVRRFGESSEIVLREAVARALVNRGIRFLQQGNDNLAKEDFSEVLACCRGEQALFNRLELEVVTALAGLQQFDEAKQVLNKIAMRKTIEPRLAKGFLSDLELIASAPEPPEGIQQFLKHAREVLKLE